MQVDYKNITIDKIFELRLVKILTRFYENKFRKSSLLPRLVMESSKSNYSNLIEILFYCMFYRLALSTTIKISLLAIL